MSEYERPADGNYGKLSEEHLAYLCRHHPDLKVRQCADAAYANKQRDKYSKELHAAARRYNNFPLN